MLLDQDSFVHYVKTEFVNKVKSLSSLGKSPVDITVLSLYQNYLLWLANRPGQRVFQTEELLCQLKVITAYHSQIKTLIFNNTPAATNQKNKLIRNLWDSTDTPFQRMLPVPNVIAVNLKNTGLDAVIRQKLMTLVPETDKEVVVAVVKAAEKHEQRNLFNIALMALVITAACFCSAFLVPNIPTGAFNTALAFGSFCAFIGTLAFFSSTQPIKVEKKLDEHKPHALKTAHGQVTQPVPVNKSTALFNQKHKATEQAMNEILVTPTLTDATIEGIFSKITPHTNEEVDNKNDLRHHVVVNMVGEAEQHILLDNDLVRREGEFTERINAFKYKQEEADLHAATKATVNFFIKHRYGGLYSDKATYMSGDHFLIQTVNSLDNSLSALSKTDVEALGKSIPKSVHI